MKKIVLIFVAIALVASPSTVYSNTRTGEGGDLPYYARIERGEILHTDEWAAIIFYRPPECVPEDFNLLDFYNFDAFSCAPPTTDGFIIWSGEPWLSDPIQINLKGLGAVPVWLVKWSELETAIGDDELTMTELVEMPSLLKGSAIIYAETLHPLTGKPDVKKPPMIEYVARGALIDGGSFYIHALMVVGKISKMVIELR